MTVSEVVTLETAITIRCALRRYRNDLIDSWLVAYRNGDMGDEHGCGFWAGRIRIVNDAVAEVYKL